MNVTLPDGTVLQNVPDGMSRADLVTKLKGNGYDTSALEKIPAAAAAPPPAAPMTTMGSIYQGMKDPITGAAQLLTHMLPDSVVQAGNKINNAIADSTGLVARIPDAGFDQQIKDNEAQYQAGRQAAMPATMSGLITGQQATPGIDWARMGGNVISPANLAIATRLPVATSLVGRLAQGAGIGAAGGATAPVTHGDYLTQKAAQVGLGAAGGALVPAVTGGVSSLISPGASTNPALQTLLQAGVKPSIGQTLGGMANNVEQKLTSVPLLGSLIGNARQAPAAQVEAAVANRALNPIGQTLPAGLTGNAAVDHVGRTLGAGYDALLPKLTTQADGQFMGDVGNLQTMMANGSIDPAKAAQFNNILQNQVLSKFQPGANGAPTLTGQTVKDIQSDLGQLSGQFGRSPDPDQQMVGNALSEVRNSLMDNVKRSNPLHAPALEALDTGYANFKRMQKAAGYVGADEGSFSPAQLQSAVRALDTSKDKARFASGNALMQDLSGAAKSVLGSTVPDSGTAGRYMMGAAAMGGALEAPNLMSMAMSHPLMAAGALSTPALYSPWGQALLRGAVTMRPNGAQPVANALQQITPALVPAGAYFGFQERQ